MDWNTLASAFIGGIAGSAVTGVVGYLRLRDERAKQRRERQMLDAEVVADVDQLLKDLDPQRRGMSLGIAAVEDERWGALNQRTERAYRELVKLATGHSIEAIQVLATGLSSAVLRAAYQSEWYVRDLLAQRYESPALEVAQKEHAGAQATLSELKGAIKGAGTPRPIAPRLRRRTELR